MSDRPAVPYVDLPKQAHRIKQELMTSIERVLDHGGYALGPELRDFEERIAAYCGTRFAVGVGSGTAALILALRSLNIGPGDEVITAPNSFIASAGAVAMGGGRPEFVDVDEETMNLDPERLEGAVTSRTKAIMPVHLTGQSADMDPILEAAGRHGIPVIEDAAQSVGATYHGRRVGGLGRLGCFSLHALKNLHAYGDAGVITTNDEALSQWLLKARNHGMRDRDTCEFWSANDRMDTLHAAVCGVKLTYLDDWTRERREIAKEFCEALRDLVGVPDEAPGCLHVYQTFMIRADRRDDLVRHLHSRGVDAKVHYPVPLYQQAPARALGHRPEDFPIAHSLSRRVVSLPLYPELTRDQRDAVIQGVRSFYEA